MSQDQQSSSSPGVTISEMVCDAHKFFDKYKITSVFGTGPFGIVFKCHRRSDNAVVAAKKLLKENVDRYTSANNRLVPMEIFALYHLANIEGVIKILDVYNFDHYYLIMTESVENFKTLREHLETEKKIDEQEAKIYMKKLISTTISCHQQGITHRDINTSNILIDPSTKKILLIDFGYAEYVVMEPFYRILGTTMFYPPESIVGTASTSESISVWSLGVTLYYMLFGKLPFNSKAEIVREEPQFYENLTSPCEDFLRGCFTKAYERRVKLQQLLDHPFISSENEQYL